MPEKPDQKKRDFVAEFHTSSSALGGRSWFFGIGINEYMHFTALHNAVKDVRDLVGLLQDRYDLTPEHTFTLFDGEATRKNIITTLDRLQRDVGPSDSLIIYYSGHGHLDKRTGKGYWIPTDAERDNTSAYIRNSTIREYIETFDTLHTLLISDSCFSGSLFVRGASRSASAIDELAAIPSRWAICSGRHDEEVFDGQPGANSPFSESIQYILRTNERPRLNVAKLADRVVEMTRANYQQLPEGAPLYGVGHKGGQYVFRLKGHEGTISEPLNIEHKPSIVREGGLPPAKASKSKWSVRVIGGLAVLSLILGLRWLWLQSAAPASSDPDTEWKAEEQKPPENETSVLPNEKNNGDDPPPAETAAGQKTSPGPSPAQTQAPEASKLKIYRFSGSVKDQESSEGMADVAIYAGGKLLGVTNEAGFFSVSMEDEKLPSILLSFRKDGFNNYIKDIALPGVDKDEYSVEVSPAIKLKKKPD